MSGSSLAAEAASRWVSLVVADAMGVADKAAEEASKGIFGTEVEIERNVDQSEARSPSKDLDRHMSVLPPIAEVASPEAATPRKLLQSVHTCRDMQQPVNGNGCHSHLLKRNDKWCMNGCNNDSGESDTQEPGFTTLKAQAEMIECKMAMLLMEAGQLCNRMDTNIRELKKMQEQQTQHQTEQQSQELVTSISTMVCSHVDKEFVKMSQQQERQLSWLSKLVCDALNLESAPGSLVAQEQAICKHRLAALPVTPPFAKMEESGRKTVPTLVRSASAEQARHEARCMVRAPSSQTLRALPVGSLNMSAVDNVAQVAGGLTMDASPKVRSEPHSARDRFPLSQPSVSPPHSLNLRPRELPEAKTTFQSARGVGGAATVVVAPPPGVTQRGSLPATRWPNRLTLVRSNSADWGSTSAKPHCKPIVSSVPLGVRRIG